MEHFDLYRAIHGLSVHRPIYIAWVWVVKQKKNTWQNIASHAPQQKQPQRWKQVFGYYSYVTNLILCNFMIAVLEKIHAVEADT